MAAACEVEVEETELAFDTRILIGAVVALATSSALLLRGFLEGKGNLTWSLAGCFGCFLALTLGSWWLESARLDTTFLNPLTADACDCGFGTD